MPEMQSAALYVCGLKGNAKEKKGIAACISWVGDGGATIRLPKKWPEYFQKCTKHETAPWES